MTRPTVVITHWVHDDVIALLERSCRVVANQTRQTLPRSEILRRCADARGLIAFMPDRIDAEFISACPKLEIVAAALKGYDNFDVTACHARGVAFSISRDLLTVPTAELAIGLMIGLDRQITSGDRLVRSGQFHGWRPILYGKGLAGSTVGIIGMGAIGTAVAHRLEAFGCRIAYFDQPGPRISPEVERFKRAGSFEELLAASDYLVTAVPLTSETFRLINDTTLAGMKPGALLINIGRGSVVDEEAVARALKNGSLGGYAADVFAFEDWAQHDRPKHIPASLLEIGEKVLFTPHLGSAVDQVRREIALEAAHAVLEVVAPSDGKRAAQP